MKKRRTETDPEVHVNTRDSATGVEEPAVPPVPRPEPSPLRDVHAEAEAHRVRMQ